MNATGESRWRSALGLVAWLVAVALAAGLGSLASADAASFYATLSKPAWAPPSGWFGPVWGVLYLAMAVAAWLVWRERGFAGAPFALSLFVVQLCVNALWSWLFFEWHLGLAALGDIVLLAALIVVTALTFWRVHRLAGVLLLPYLAWVLFAAALNFHVWRLNPGALA